MKKMSGFILALCVSSAAFAQNQTDLYAKKIVSLFPKTNNIIIDGREEGSSQFCSVFISAEDKSVTVRSDSAPLFNFTPRILTENNQNQFESLQVNTTPDGILATHKSTTKSGDWVLSKVEVLSIRKKSSGVLAVQINNKHASSPVCVVDVGALE